MKKFDDYKEKEWYNEEKTVEELVDELKTDYDNSLERLVNLMNKFANYKDNVSWYEGEKTVEELVEGMK